MNERQRVAVVGAGVAGIVSAWLISQRHDVVLFERKNYLGGHTNTVTIDHGPDEGTRIDTGFIVCNDKTYPVFHRFLKSLAVPWRWSDMSFSYYNERTGFHYAGTDLNGLFAQRKNLFNPQFYAMLLEIVRFSRAGLRDLHSAHLDHITLGDYLDEKGFSRNFRQNYLIPMGAAIWSTPPGKMLRFPAKNFLRFFKNHGLLSMRDRPRWQTVVNGSKTYVEAFERQFSGQVRCQARIEKIARSGEGIELIHDDGSREPFDHVVMGVHADQVLPLLENPTEDERRLFSAWRYEKNSVVLHTDIQVLPPARRAWASWNYTRERSATKRNPLSMSYYMNRLQGLKTQRDYSVTLNRGQRIPDEHIVRELCYSHPLYTPESIATQKELPTLNGKERTYFCGSYFRFGFHEDAVRAGADAARHFGVAL